jgi:hypothetical protein
VSIVVSFEDFTPAARYDSISWTGVEIEEAATAAGSYSLIDTQALAADADPADPQARSFSTANGTEDDQWYRVRFFDVNGDYSEYTDPIQNVQDDTYAVAYATTDELARILKLRAPTVEQSAAMLRVLTTAALEIDSELGRAGMFGTPYPPLVIQVNLERAVEHWQQQEAAFGIIGLGGAEGFSVRTARDTWDRHAHKLAPLKDTWGLA